MGARAGEGCATARKGSASMTGAGDGVALRAGAVRGRGVGDGKGGVATGRGPGVAGRGRRAAGAGGAGGVAGGSRRPPMASRNFRNSSPGSDPAGGGPWREARRFALAICAPIEMITTISQKTPSSPPAAMWMGMFMTPPVAPP